MKSKNNAQNRKSSGPFSDGADAHLINMGLLKKDGASDKNNMAAFIVIYSGLFYMDLLQYHKNADNIKIIYNKFSSLHSKKRYHYMYLLYSMQYDYFRKPLPDPVWWIAGNQELIAVFMNGFLERLGKLIEESIIINRHSEGGAET